MSLPRTLSWPLLALFGVIISAVWGYIQISMMPILPFFFIMWWIASAGIQFLIGRFLADRIQLRPSGKQLLPVVAYGGGVLLMFSTYLVAQVILPLLVIHMPMIAAKTPFLPSLIIECIILAAGVVGFMTTLQRRIS